MRSINIDLELALAVVKGVAPMNSIVGRAKDEHGTFYAAFVATDRDTGAVRGSDDGKRVKLNLRASRTPAERAAK